MNSYRALESLAPATQPTCVTHRPAGGRLSANLQNNRQSPATLAPIYTHTHLHAHIPQPSPFSCSLQPFAYQSDRHGDAQLPRCLCVLLVGVYVQASVLLHQNTLNRARITDASVQQVCKSSPPGVAPQTLLSLQNCQRPGKDDIMHRRLLHLLILAGINRCLASQHSNSFPPFYDCLF